MVDKIEFEPHKCAMFYNSLPTNADVRVIFKVRLNNLNNDIEKLRFLELVYSINTSLKNIGTSKLTEDIVKNTIYDDIDLLNWSIINDFVKLIENNYQNMNEFFKDIYFKYIAENKQLYEVEILKGILEENNEKHKELLINLSNYPEAKWIVLDNLIEIKETFESESKMYEYLTQNNIVDIINQLKK